MTLLVALTGGIGTGKSTACAMFASLGAPVLDADLIARELVEPGAPALKAIVERFGHDLLGADGRLDRARLRALVFRSAPARRQLEDLLHPRILHEMQARARALEAPYCILCIPLLAETGQARLFDRVVVVDAPRNAQLARVGQRDRLTAGQVEAIIQVQACREDRLRLADDVIVNSGDIDSLRAQVAGLHERYLQAGRTGVGASL
ncbi:MAG: dephospho-CoA kinase [Gammaproteobacteria bacterium]